MRTHSVVRSGWAGAPGAVLLGALLAFHGCGLDDVDIPELDGPSTFAANLTLRITPGPARRGRGEHRRSSRPRSSTQNGRPAAEPARSSSPSPTRTAGSRTSATSRPPRAPASRVTVRTDAQGVARVVYQAPPRTDATADQTVLIAARPIGDDASAARLPDGPHRAALRGAAAVPAEPRTTQPPACGFAVETPSGLPRRTSAILFQTHVRSTRTARSCATSGSAATGTAVRATRRTSRCVYRTAGHATRVTPRRDGRRRRHRRPARRRVHHRAVVAGGRSLTVPGPVAGPGTFAFRGQRGQATRGSTTSASGSRRIRARACSRSSPRSCARTASSRRRSASPARACRSTPTIRRRA